MKWRWDAKGRPWCYFAALIFYASAPCTHTPHVIGFNSSEEVCIFSTAYFVNFTKLLLINICAI